MMKRKYSCPECRFDFLLMSWLPLAQCTECGARLQILETFDTEEREVRRMPAAKIREPQASYGRGPQDSWAVLPVPVRLPEETVRVTLKLNKSSVDFFKAKSKAEHTQYHRMIRRLLEHYARFL